jgi:HPr kinase/phosphorylase
VNTERKIVPIPVATFFDAGADELRLELVGGQSGLKRRIAEATVHRPGLALTGFFAYFANKRVQLVGLAEYTYLHSLGEKVRRRRLRDFFSRNIPCVVFARGKGIFPEVSDLATEFRVPVFRTRMVTKLFANAATILTENLMAPRMTVQGTMVEIMGIGVLIEGKEGMGKSEAALGLVKRGHALVSDDITQLRVDSSGSVIGSPVNITRYHMEIRGLGIIHVPSLFGVASVRGEKKLDFVVTLCEPGGEAESNRDSGARGFVEYMGVRIPRMYIPVAPGRELSNVLETAALDAKLKALGHDAVKELDAQLVAHLTRGKSVSE